MSLLPDSASFFEEVQAFFLTCRGDGVALSDADARLIAKWEAVGVPAGIVCQGIRAALSKHVFEDRAVSRPRSLRSCRKEVEQEIRRFQSLHTGQSQNQAASLECGQTPGTEASDYFRQRAEELRQRLHSLRSEGRLSDRQLTFLTALAATADGCSLERFNEAVLIFQARQRPLNQRIGIVRRAKAAAGPKPPMASPRARAALLHQCLLCAIREAEDELQT